jgi:hypothetical protein
MAPEYLTGIDINLHDPWAEHGNICIAQACHS